MSSPPLPFASPSSPLPSRRPHAHPAAAAAASSSVPKANDNATNGAHDAPPKTRRERLNDIPDLVSSVLTAHLRDCERRALDVVHRAFAAIDLQLAAQRADYARCVARHDFDFSEPLRLQLRRALSREGLPFPSTSASASASSLAAAPDVPALALQAVPKRLAPLVRIRGGFMRQPPIRMPALPPLPRYDAWIPVRTNFWVGKDVHLEPYMPFLGDQEAECEQAYEVFEDMAGDAGKDMDLSDGEVNNDGKLVLPSSESERIKFHAMASCRWRAACRAAIRAVVTQFAHQHQHHPGGGGGGGGGNSNSNSGNNGSSSTDEAMWRILAQALGMNDVRRVKAVAAKADERFKEADDKKRRRKLERFVDAEVRRMRRQHLQDKKQKRRCPRRKCNSNINTSTNINNGNKSRGNHTNNSNIRNTRSTANNNNNNNNTAANGAMHVVADDDDGDDGGGNEDNDFMNSVGDDAMRVEDGCWNAHSTFLKHFCFVCHIFSCLQHTVQVEPILPIEDLETTRRETLLRDNAAKPCSNDCFLRPRRRRLPHGASEWAPEEILILREAVPIFGLDPCSLAQIVGSRSCAEVSAQLADPIEADIAAQEIEKARKPRRLEPNLNGNTNGLGADGETAGKGTTSSKRRSKAQQQQQQQKQQQVAATKGIVDSDGECQSNDQDFTPCDHAGPCTAETCPCVKAGMYCESMCGCNFGRYGEGGACGGVVWLPPSEETVRSGLARECLNRHYGCLCRSGHCSDTTCPCWDQNRACNPDLCECDCTVLPGHAPLAKRRCRNTPLTIAHHKRTFVGKSDIHGYGLFAGERFEPGDLVGAYAGQLIDTRLADMIGRIYDATNRTYIFNVTESLVIDGGLLGSKAKFCNHTRPGDGENCASRLVRVRGDAYVALLCKRTVEVGDEFLFDYRFTGEVPAWAREEKGGRGSRK